MLSTAPGATAAAALALFQADTVFVVQRAPEWMTWIQALSAIATIVVAIALLLIGFGLIFAALKVKQLTRKMEEQAGKLRVDLAPAVANVNRVAENAGALSETVRADSARLSETVASANDALRRAAVEAERRVGEFNALIGVVQEEAEHLFIGGASTIRGLRAGTEHFRRYHDRREEADDDGADEAFDDDEDTNETEIRVTRRGRKRSWLDD